MKIYKSKVDIWLVAIIFVPLGFAVYHAFQEKDWIPFGGLLIVILLILYACIGIKYIIENDMLSVKIGFFPTGKVKISEIIRIEKSYSPLSAPALSIQRLEIITHEKSLLISPENRKEFINELLKINSNIEVKL